MALGYSAVSTATGITVVIDGTTVSIPKDALNYEQLLAAIKRRGTKEEVLEHISPKQTVERAFAKEGFLIAIDTETDALAVVYNGVEVDDAISKKVLELYKAGKPTDPIRRFVEKALNSLSYEKASELMKFVVKNNLPIHPDGDVIAYKAVRSDGYDKHSGTVLYQLGEYTAVDKSKCDPNPNNECSRGLHVGGRQYVKGFSSGGGKIFVVKVDPGNFIAVPHADFQKARVWRMFVYSQVFGDVTQEHLGQVVAEHAEGDIAEAAAGGGRKLIEVHKDSAVGEVHAEKKAAKKVVKKLKKAEKKKVIEETVAAVAERTFETTSGIKISAAELLDAVARLGQRGASRETGIPRSTIQDWMKELKG